MHKTYEIILDIENEIYSPSNLLFSVSQNDLETIELTFTIRQDNNDVDLTGTTVEMAVKKPSGLTVYQSCEITDAIKGEATIQLTNQAYIEFGVYTAEVYIRIAEEIAVTCPFWYFSRSAIMDDETMESVTDWTTFQAAFTNSGDGSSTVIWQNIENKPLVFHADLSEPDLTAALNSKADDSELAGKADIIHDHEMTDVTGLTAALNLKADIGAAAPVEEHVHEIVDVTGLTAALDSKADDSELAGKADVIHTHAYADITEKPTTFTPSAHSHTLGEVIGLQTTLDTKLETIPAEYLTQTEGDLLYDRQPLTGTIDPTGAPLYIGQIYVNTITKESFIANSILGDWQTISADELGGGAGSIDWVNVTSKPNTFTPSAHTHLWADITDKPTTFTPSAHVHIISEVTGLTAALNSKADDSELAGKADIIHDHEIVDVTGLTAALDGKADEGAAPTAHVHIISEVTGLTAALDGKADDSELAGKADIVHVHGITDVTGLTASLDSKADDSELAGKADTVHVHGITDVTGLTAALGGKAPTVHVHAISEVTGLTVALDNKADEGAAPTAHTHSFAAITDKPATYPPDTHVHTVANVTGLQGFLDAKAPISHVHTVANVTGLQGFLDAKAPLIHSHAWADVTGKPTTFTPATHSHTEADISIGGINSKTYIDNGDNYIINTKMSGLSLWQGNQAAYDGIGTKNPTTLYFIIGA